MARGGSADRVEKSLLVERQLMLRVAPHNCSTTSALTLQIGNWIGFYIEKPAKTM